jgi:hypothetical protein
VVPGAYVPESPDPQVTGFAPSTEQVKLSFCGDVQAKLALVLLVGDAGELVMVGG